MVRPLHLLRQGWKGEVRAHQRDGDFPALQTPLGVRPNRGAYTAARRAPGYGRWRCQATGILDR